MAITNHERVGKGVELLRVGLAPYIERECKSAFKEKFSTRATAFISQDRLQAKKAMPDWDVAALLKFLMDTWTEVFRNTLGHTERSLVSELLEVRNKWAHQEPFSSDDAERALDSAARLLTSISAPQADEVGKMRLELRRLVIDEQVRSEKRRGGTTIISQSTGGLPSWREVVHPHKDVASGKYQTAEFAADLWQVHIGQGSDEYLKPVEFFRRTFLTESLTRLLAGAVQRLSGKGGDPVVQLQTNFGGGKTHSMLALYHLFSGAKATELPGIDAVMKKAEIATLPAKVNRVVLVGNKLSPGNPSVKKDGTVVRTMWGELAWQLGGKKAFAKIQADDERATSPGHLLHDLMNEYGPCVILIDEWVAYARQLHDSKDLPGGDFETHFTFAQALTESAKTAKQCMLVISLPASESNASPHAQSDDVEVGGERGRAALDRLRNAVGRVEASWRPASAEEGFEIVRRRLFEPLVEQTQFLARDTVAKAYYDFYDTQRQEFPQETRDADYLDRLKMAYPIHPEVFDRLYTDWSTLVKFQRTRGVLRLMAAVIHSLWEDNDRNPLIQPGNIPIEDERVRFELTRYLSDNWTPVIDKDVDGLNSLPLRLDGEVPNLGKYMACRRVARTIYLGSAPKATAANRGIEDRRIKLGCVMPGETTAVFGDALRRLSGAATYLYQDAARYWYSTQPTVTKMAEDRAEQLKRDPDGVAKEIEERVRKDLRREGDFSRIHPFPLSTQDVPDESDARLVVLGVEFPYSKGDDSPALAKAREILKSRGNAPRLLANTLVFLAVDKTRLQDLDEAVRKYKAWSAILDEKEQLDLTPHQVKQAQTQLASADGVVNSRIPQAYFWLLTPVQASPGAPVTWQDAKLGGSDPLAVRASKKLRNDDLLTPVLAATELRRRLDEIPLWRDKRHVSIKQLVEDFARYLYLPRLKNSAVLLAAVEEGLPNTVWQQETFAFADSYDEVAGRYRGLKAGERVAITEGNLNGLLVNPELAQKQKDDESGVRRATGGAVGNAGAGSRSGGSGVSPAVASGVAGAAASEMQASTKPATPKRFHGTVELDSARVGRDAGRIAEEVIAHLTGLVGSKVIVTLEIDAQIPDGTPEHVVRTVTENSKTLKFTSQGFESE